MVRDSPFFRRKYPLIIDIKYVEHHLPNNSFIMVAMKHQTFILYSKIIMISRNVWMC